MKPDELNTLEEEREEKESEEYSFLDETVKNPPVDLRKILIKLCTLTGAAILFGVVSALVFYAVLSQRNSTSPNPVSIPHDEQLAQVLSEGVSEGDNKGGGQTGSPNNGSDGSEGKPPGNSSEGNSEPVGNAGSGESEEGEDGDAGSESDVQMSLMPVFSEEELDANAFDTYVRVEAALRRIADEAGKSVVTVTGVTAEDEWFDITNVGSRACSGLIVADNSVSFLILTDSCIVENAERIAVTLPDGTIAEAVFQKKDPVTGLCVVSIPRDKISGKSRSSLSVAVLGNSYKLNHGDSLLAVGAPSGTAGTFACGRVVSLEEAVEIVDGEYRLVTTDIYGGSACSGVLVNMDGEVVGMIEQQYAGDERYAVTALPISPIKPLIEKLSNNAPLSYIGIHGLDISDKASETQNIPAGVYISSVDEDSPALQEGIQPGDIITSVGLGSAVTLRSLHENIMNRSPGNTVDVTVMRQGHSGYKEFAFTLTIGELPEREETAAQPVRSAEAEEKTESDSSASESAEGEKSEDESAADESAEESGRAKAKES